jgi:hypothetical protein
MHVFVHVCAAGMHHRSIMGRRSTLTAALAELEASREQLTQQLYKVRFVNDGAMGFSSCTAWPGLLAVHCAHSMTTLHAVLLYGNSTVQ